LFVCSRSKKKMNVINQNIIMQKLDSRIHSSRMKAIAI